MPDWWRRRRRRRPLSLLIAAALACLAALAGSPWARAQSAGTSPPRAARVSVVSARALVAPAQSLVGDFVDGLTVGPDGAVYACFADNNVWAISSPALAPNALRRLSAPRPTQSLAFAGPPAAQYVAARWISVPFYAVASRPPVTRPLLALADFAGGRVDFVDPYGADAAAADPRPVMLFSVRVPSNLSDVPDEVTHADRFGGFFCSGGYGSPSSPSSRSNTSAVFYIHPFSLSLLPQDRLNLTAGAPPNVTLVLADAGRVAGMAVDRAGTLLYVAEQGPAGPRVVRYPISAPGALGAGEVVADLRRGHYGAFLGDAPVVTSIRVGPATDHVLLSLSHPPTVLVLHPNATAPPSPAASPPTSVPPASPAPALPRSLPLLALVRLPPSALSRATSVAVSPDGRRVYAAGPCAEPAAAGGLGPGRGCLAGAAVGPLGSNADLGMAAGNATGVAGRKAV